ncbi:MAG: serine/threonine protein kinase [Myxococcales bacterium]|nr:serine/threonine protein kinase [Myxococcales bacterium]
MSSCRLSEPPPRVADRYLLREQLADGLLGAVYRARDTNDGSAVAIKLVAPGPADEHPRDGVVRAEREHALMSRVRHPLVARSFEAGEHHRFGYLAMELVAGEDLCTFINRSVAAADLVSLERALPIVGQLCLALDSVHAAGLVHRDLKPANVMVLPDESIKLIDFGAAQRQSDAFGLWGTPLYIAPEITLRRRVPQASRTLSDIYSLGVTVYELLTGQEPFDLDADEDMATQLVSQARQTSHWLGWLRPDLPESLSVLLRAAMSSDLAQRPPTSRAFYRAFRAAALSWGCREPSRQRTHQARPMARAARPTVPLGVDAPLARTA